MLRRAASGLGRLLLGVCYVLAAFVVVLFAAAVYLIGSPLRARNPRAAMMKSMLDALAAGGVALQQADRMRRELAELERESAATDSHPQP